MNLSLYSSETVLQLPQPRPAAVTACPLSPAGWCLRPRVRRAAAASWKSCCGWTNPAAAVCFNDLVALGVMEALALVGKKPGAQFGVIGYNDVAAAAQSRPRLTTVDTAPHQLGEAAAELLLKRIARRDALVQTLVLQPWLIVRESCGTLPY